MRRLRILVLMRPDLVPPDSTDGYTARQINEWKTEFDVVSTLRESGHDVRPLGVQDEIIPMRDEIESFMPHVVFPLLEEFHYEAVYDQHIASYLELMQIPYTGCNPRGLILARGKDLSKTLVHHRRIAVIEEGADLLVQDERHLGGADPVGRDHLDRRAVVAAHEGHGHALGAGRGEGDVGGRAHGLAVAPDAEAHEPHRADHDHGQQGGAAHR